MLMKLAVVMNNSRANEVLKRYFGYEFFREGQAELIDALTSGRDGFGIMPTGAGKSLCYQIPALLLPGVTLVISPLISLMRDQVQALVANGVPAAFINSSLTDVQVSKVMSNACNGMYKIIYIAPERLETPSIQHLAAALQISLVAVDEAHCISQWGQDFRPSYLDIPRFVRNLPTRPVLAAFTATATPRVSEDILRTLGLIDPVTLATGFDRPNLYFEVRQPKDKYAALAEYLGENGGIGIVYCATRKEVEAVTERLHEDGHSAARYHAGLSDAERSRAQDDFLHDRVRIIVATNAFGMGIDKSNVRFVIHYNMPKNIESYYQEAGRAGRDGLPADCIMFYARKDLMTALFLINQSGNRDEAARNRKLLDEIERFCETDACLRKYVLQYFGDSTSFEGNCGNCGNCNGNTDAVDVTVDAQKILSHITRLNKAGVRPSIDYAASIIQGTSQDFADLPTFGIMRDAKTPYINRLIRHLTKFGYIRFDWIDGLSTMPTARDVLINGRVVTMRGQKSGTKSDTTASKRRKAASGSSAVNMPLSEALLAKLKALRLDIAKEEGVPAFVVFSDATLVDMCQKRPRTDDEMLDVSGVGQVKLERYARRFLEMLTNHDETADDAPPSPLPKLTSNILLQEAEIINEPLPITRVADSINAVLLKYGEAKTTGTKLNATLIEGGYLEEIDKVKLPTELGKAAGITTVLRESSRGDFTQCLFDAQAQKLIVENFNLSQN